MNPETRRRLRVARYLRRIASDWRAEAEHVADPTVHHQIADKAAEVARLLDPTPHPKGR